MSYSRVSRASVTALAENGRTWLAELGRTLRSLLRHWQTAVRLRQSRSRSLVAKSVETGGRV